ncbi:MAG TPA: GntR family transcriptional regulator [Azospirillaceae bacterium]|nr:GntR family transcriptional regulator [Azospirillaceae bacterium]
MSSVSDRFDYGSAKLNEIVEQVLRAGIRAGRIPAGALLQEARLSDQFDLSRAPVHQALRRLEQDGLVAKAEGRGYVVGGADAAAVRPLAELDIPEAAREALRSRAGWERIYKQVERDVVGVMAFGRYGVVELALAEAYGVSRTITRDVLGRLEERGLLEKVQRSHWAVPQLTPRLMHELYEMRRLLEPAALLDAADGLAREEVAAMRDRLRAAEARYPDVSVEELSAFEHDLHIDLVGRCSNPRLLSAIRQSQTPLVATAYLFQQYLGIPQDEPFLVEHRLVLEHLLAGAPGAAAAALEAHMVSALRKGLGRLEFLSRLPHPEPPAFLQRLG